MFDNSCIYPEVLAQKMIVPAQFPDSFESVKSDYFWRTIEYDAVEEIVAIRAYPADNVIAIKLMYRDEKKYKSIYIHKPELRVLKHIWDCHHKSTDGLISFYLANSENALNQYRHGRNLANIEYILWFKKIMDQSGHNNA